jgi:hypothetical protein
MSFCTQCGQRNEGTRFCVACGNLVSNSPGEPAANANSGVPLPGVFPRPPNEEFVPGDAASPPSYKRNRTVILSSAVAVAATVLTIMLWPKPSPATDALTDLCAVMSGASFEDLSWVDSSELGDAAEVFMSEANRLDRETAQPINSLMGEYSQWVDDTGEMIIDFAIASALDDWSEMLDIASRAEVHKATAAALDDDFREACVPFS